ncbi:MAG: hypothetical protein HFK09_01700 [Clostridia bacterium]|nr:hypothetical protein [Clostridia bacterium]
MSGKMIMGLALGAALGMYVASKNSKVRNAISGAEDAVMNKLSQQTDSSSQQNEMQ